MALPFLVANKLVRIDDAGDAAIVFSPAGSWFVGPHHAAATLNDDILFAAGNLRRKSNFELYGGTYLERSVGADIDAGGAEIASDAARFAGRILFMNFDRQMQWKS